MSYKSCVFGLLALLTLSGCTAPEPPLSRVSPTPVPPEFQGWWREYQAGAGTSYIYLSDKTHVSQCLLYRNRICIKFRKFFFQFTSCRLQIFTTSGSIVPFLLRSVILQGLSP